MDVIPAPLPAAPSAPRVSGMPHSPAAHRPTTVTTRSPRSTRLARAAHPSEPKAADSLRAERYFRDWLADPTKPDAVRFDGDAESTSLTVVLGLVSTSLARLPAEAAVMLGMRDGVTVGKAAAELVLAVNDPAGPRCRSYRAAVYYLHDLCALEAAFDDL